MKRLSLCLSILFISLCSFAQNMNDTTHYKKNIKIIARFGLQGVYQDLPDLNNNFKSNTLPSTGKFQLGFNFGADLKLQNFLASITVSGNANTKKSGNYNVSFMNMFDELSAGYYFLNVKNFHVAPMVGIGLYGAKVMIAQKSGYSDFNQLLQEKNSISINQTSGAADFGLRFDFADFTKNPDYFAGVKIGFLYGLNKPSWGIDEYNNSTVYASPRDRIKQYYLTFYLGKSRTKHAYKS